MKKVALVTGIAGQDGSYLTEHLLNAGYEVHGIVRRQSTAENQESRISHLEQNKNLHTHYGDLLDISSLSEVMLDAKPTHIFNLAAMSHVRVSFDIPQFTIQTNGLGLLNVLELYRKHCPEAKFYQASSSEMFGNSVDDDGFQRETTPMNPVSPYGCSKVLGYNLVRHYRNAYNLHACNGILFNHESPRRGSNFVTNKVVKTAVQIKLDLIDKLEMGNMDSYRDWGHSKDYTRGMLSIINHDTPDDFVLSTGKTYSVRDLCRVVFEHLDLNYEDYVVQNSKYMRPEELKYLKGDCTKAKTILNWEPEYTFESMMHEMVDHWMEVFFKVKSNMKKILLFDLEKKENHTPNGLFSMAGGEDYDFYGNVIKRHPKNIRYVLDSDYYYDVIMGVDRALFHNFYGIKASPKLKVAWLLTPRDIYDNIYTYVVGMIPHIDIFITSDKEFVEEHEKAIYVPSINNWDNNKSFDGFDTPEDWIYENVLKEHIG